MTPPNAAATSPQAKNQQVDVARQFRQAQAELARQEFGDLTNEEIDQCIAAGDWPWSDDGCEST